MSAKIGILESHQKPTDSPSRHVKKSVAEYLRHTLQADIVPGRDRVIQMRVIRPAVTPEAKRAAQPQIPKPYIPEKLPSSEIPGCYFEQPESARFSSAIGFVGIPSSEWNLDL